MSVGDAVESGRSPQGRFGKLEPKNREPVSSRSCQPAIDPQQTVTAQTWPATTGRPTSAAPSGGLARGQRRCHRRTQSSGATADFHKVLHDCVTFRVVRTRPQSSLRASPGLMPVTLQPTTSTSLKPAAPARTWRTVCVMVGTATEGIENCAGSRVCWLSRSARKRATGASMLRAKKSVMPHRTVAAIRGDATTSARACTSSELQTRTAAPKLTT